MSNWIDDLKEQDVQHQEHLSSMNAIRLHNANVVRAKAPALWSLLIIQIEAYLEQLRASFPHDMTRQADLIKRGDSYTLQGKKLPLSVMKLTLNLDGSCINISQGIKHEFADRPTLTPSKPIDFKVTNDEDVVFFWKDWNYADPSLIAEQLVKIACRLH
ncbi:MAG: hypothetical protein ABR976_13510 [Terracidiphilus sp.]|jgi:hypothetical protein